MDLHRLSCVLNMAPSEKHLCSLFSVRMPVMVSVLRSLDMGEN